MSHFKVLVIGDNVEEQLAPYDENMEVTPYPEEGFDFKTEVANARDYLRRHPEDLEGLDDPDDDLEIIRWYEGDDIDLRKDADGNWQRYTTYNPDSKWDWWTVGGRYNGSFLLKANANPEDYSPGEIHWTDPSVDLWQRTDSARKRAIDFETPVAEARAEAERQWSKLERLTLGIAPPAKGWSEFQEDYSDIIEAREAWNSHPWNEASRELGSFFGGAYKAFFMDRDDPRSAYIRQQEAFAVGGFYAVVQDGDWAARGDMGWFGISDDKVDSTEWYERVKDLIESLPDDTLLTTVDCHI